ncbi:uncharacterized protein PITG_21153 [Phytophthora infestans T30-4]|uniref:malate dehydrogenase n=1 Tax=Phytophthora infestans (strain T30-4) TaxID=403677 RepID=D0P338_PHYIT|nr:uncharacterized protein PITG_21153 [Phytophthora infestans T30-4]EEY58811.1 hypothetical protein PITG_21153 [Phytophthora infestans T30-4]|eukprot:XP_002895285.1 hypothetical protein PITG_21153 [Phytophthora infestans T30-4]
MPHATKLHFALQLARQVAGPTKSSSPASAATEKVPVAYGLRAVWPVPGDSGTAESHINTHAKVTGHVGMEQAGEALEGADVVVIPAGVPRKPGMTRDDLFNTNPIYARTETPTGRSGKPIDYVFAAQGFAVDDDNDEDYDPERDPDDGRNDNLKAIPSTIWIPDQGRHTVVSANTDTDRLKDNTDNAKEANEGEIADVKSKCDGEQQETTSILRFVPTAQDEAEKAARDEAEKLSETSSHTAVEDDMKPARGTLLPSPHVSCQICEQVSVFPLSTRRT